LLAQRRLGGIADAGHDIVTDRDCLGAAVKRFNWRWRGRLDVLLRGVELIKHRENAFHRFRVDMCCRQRLESVDAQHRPLAG
jgi:hypothetical protein